MSERRPFPGPVAALLLTLAAWGVGIAVASSLGPSLGLAAVGIGQVVGLGSVALLATRGIPPPHGERIGFRGVSLRAVPLLVLLLPLTVLGSEANNVARALVPPAAAAEATAQAQQLLARLTEPGPLLLVERWVVVVGLAPVLEEWLFRGVLQQGLVAHLGRWGGVFGASALFALGHTDPGSSVGAAFVSFAAALGLGVVLGLVRLATGSLLASILVHAGTNAAGLVAVALAARLAVPGFNAPGAHTPPEVLVPCALAVGVAVVLLARAAARAPAAPPVPEREDED